MKNGIVTAFTLLACLCLVVEAHAGDWPQWHGPRRDSICTETGLLRQWPAGGPPLLRTIDGMGMGWSSPVVVEQRIYITGAVDGRLKVRCFGATGERIWEADNGLEFTGRFPGARATPTVDGAMLYVVSGVGRLAALRIEDGSEQWSVEITRRFRTSVPKYGFAECLLVDDGKVYCTPGGPDAAVAALDKHTGETVWASRGLSHGAAYSHPIAFDCGGIRQIATLTAKSMVGLSADTGRLLWQYDRPCNERGNVIATPVYRDGRVFGASGYDCGGGAARLVEAEGQWRAEQIWDTTAMRAQHGGYVLVEGYLYGNDDAKGWCCLDFNTGVHQWTERGVGKGSILYADGMLYCFSERGTMGLAAATPREHTLVGRFDLPDVAERSEWGQTDRFSWAHPVISDGLLYLRSMNRLYVYNVRKE